ncbi:hypothetical protein NJB14197_41840 [Mycobacterium montefiorense]|uniref:Uncharacterized protein n=1 Tax=Mycobacterium montefiorense TaxID=154654 RepID=A0AA37PMP6_9MYCO|nr:hypothetical protein MmonteBS_02560 [Mycobacterium montefiorense]GKU35388.1 hypothetical protein NJB14191_27340 [Mycobacterium montefiorense]GKU40389.1 hypothetical protein NJB14192_23760 [Mycobacterium montefiorense]GKU45767.1 hypothetical protein NJB14194_23880 [Mycobacterium montefiorense]GKU50123.1 hypothetical protein NJB14195_13690 [Mycobacterium montefiorense]
MPHSGILSSNRRVSPWYGNYCGLRDDGRGPNEWSGMSGLKSKLILAAILTAAATATAGCTVPFTVDCGTFTCSLG